MGVSAWILPTLGKTRLAQPLPRPSYGAESLLADGAEDSGSQQLLERQLTGKVRAALDEFLGAGHFRVILHADARADGGLGRLSMDLVIDEGTLRYDAATGKYLTGRRSPGEIDAGFAAAKKAAGFDPNRGDRASFTTLAFDHTGMIESETDYRRAEEQRIWATIRAAEA